MEKRVRKGSHISNKRRFGTGVVDYGGREPHFLRVVLGEDAVAFLVDKAAEIESGFGVVLEPPEHEHVTIATGEELDGIDKA